MEGENAAVGSGEATGGIEAGAGSGEQSNLIEAPVGGFFGRAEERNGQSEQTAEPEPELIGGKYKNTEELLNAYQRLLKAHRARGDALDDDTLDAIHRERFPDRAVPEAYELNDAFEQHGFLPFEREEEQAEFGDWAKSNEFTQKQINAMAERGGEMLRSTLHKVLDAHGLIFDAEQAKSDLTSLIGPDYGSKLARLSRWAEASGLTDMLYKPAAMNPRGAAFWLKVMEGTKGSSPLQNTEAPSGVGLGDLETKMNRIMQSPAYENQWDPGHKQAHAEVDRIIDQLHRFRQQHGA